MQEIDKYKKTIASLYNNLESEKRSRKEEQIQLMEERQQRQNLESKIIDLEVELRWKSDQLEQLQFNNVRLSKRLESLMEQRQQEQQNQKQSGFMDMIWTGKSKDNLIQMDTQLKILQDDLDLKINENELAHMQIFEIKKQNQKQQDIVNNKLNKQLEINDGQQKMIDRLKTQEEELKNQIDEMQKRQGEMEKTFGLELEELKDKQNDLQNNLTKISQQESFQRKIIQKRLLFIDDEQTQLNNYNNPKLNYQINLQFQQILSRLDIHNLQFHLKETLQLYQKRSNLIIQDIQTQDNKNYKMFIYFNKKLQNMLKGEIQVCLSIFQGVEDWINGNGIQKILSSIQNSQISQLAKIFKQVFQEEHNLIDNIQLLQQDNSSQHLLQFSYHLQTLFSYLTQFNQNYYISQNISKKNQYQLLKKIQITIVKGTNEFEQFINSIIEKVELEIDSLQGDGLRFNYKIGVIVTLQKMSQDLIQECKSLLNQIQTVSVLVQQLLNLMLQNQNQIPHLSNEQANNNQIYFQKMFNFLQNHQPGINYTLALQNQQQITQMTIVNQDQMNKLNSLKQAIQDSEVEIEKLQKICAQLEDHKEIEQENILIEQNKNVINGSQKISIQQIDSFNGVKQMGDFLKKDQDHSEKTKRLFEIAKQQFIRLNSQLSNQNDKFKDLDYNYQNLIKQLNIQKESSTQNEQFIKQLEQALEKSQQELNQVKQMYENKK